MIESHTVWIRPESDFFAGAPGRSVASVNKAGGTG
jgi:hypothetical protein